MAILKNLNVLEDFKCIADRCPDNCCQNWDIDIDEKAYSLWSRLEEPAFNAKLVNNIVIKDEKRVIKLLSNGDCCHKDVNGLCSIHKNLGEEYLADICAKYPRIKFKNHEILTHTAQLSCPEITRLVLESEKSSLFNTQIIPENELALTEDTCSFIDDPLLIKLRTILTDYYAKVTIIKPLSLGIWLYDMADITTSFTNQIKNDTFSFELLQKKCGKSKKNIQNRFSAISNEIKLKKRNIDINIESEFWSAVFQIYQNNTITEFDEQFDNTQVKKLLANNQQASIGEVIKKNVKTLSGKINLENKLINYALVKFHNHGFPWYPYQGNYIATYLQCVLPISIVILLLILFGFSGKSVDDALLAKIIYKVETKFGQNTYIFQLLQNDAYLRDLESYKSVFLRLALN